MQESVPQEKADNIIAFPNKKSNRPPASLEEMKEIMEANKTEMIEYFVEELTKEIFTITANHGYTITHAKDIAYILISLKAILLRQENIHHPIQDFIDATIDAESIQPID